MPTVRSSKSMQQLGAFLNALYMLDYNLTPAQHQPQLSQWKQMPPWADASSAKIMNTPRPLHFYIYHPDDNMPAASAVINMACQCLSVHAC